MYKVFFNKKIIYLIENINFFNKPKNSVLHHFNSKTELTALIENFSSNAQKDNLIIHTIDLGKLAEDFFSIFNLIEAAGGLVKNEINEILFIFRRGKWDLPKGKIDAGEQTDRAAIREVEEETGIRNISITKKLQSTFHMYILKNQWVVKETHWFEMKTNSIQKLIPQIEEDITKVEWKSQNEVQEVLDNTYDSIRELIAGYIK